jgi:hypothetical protein
MKDESRWMGISRADVNVRYEVCYSCVCIYFVIITRYLKISVFGNMTQCSLVERYKCFCRTCRIQPPEESRM